MNKKEVFKKLIEKLGKVKIDKKGLLYHSSLDGESFYTIKKEYWLLLATEHLGLRNEDWGTKLNNPQSDSTDRFICYSITGYFWIKEKNFTFKERCVTCSNHRCYFNHNLNTNIGASLITKATINDEQKDLIYLNLC